MTITKLPSNRYRLQIRRARLRVDEVYDTRKLAREAEQKYLGRKEAAKGHRTPTLDVAWDRYRASREFAVKKPLTRRSEETHIKPALRALGLKPVETITAEDIEKLITSRLKAKKAADTIRNEVAALSAVMVFCVRRHMVSSNPVIGVPRPSPEKKLRRMAPGDEGALMKLLAHPNFRFRSAARLCLLVRETGARPGEWVNVKWADIDLRAQKVSFPNTKYKGLPRTIPLTNAAVGLLSTQLEDITLKQFDVFGDSEYVFPTVGREGDLVPLAYSGTVRDLKVAKLLPSHFRAHSGRHEFISKLVEDSDLDDARIMSLVGHHSPTSMQIYTHARNVRYRENLEALEPKRRTERAQSYAAAAGLPKEVIDSYLDHRRKAEADDALADAGNELLFTSKAQKDLSRVTQRFGETESERFATLLEFRSAKLRKSNTPGASSRSRQKHLPARRSEKPKRRV